MGVRGMDEEDGWDGMAVRAYVDVEGEGEGEVEGVDDEGLKTKRGIRDGEGEERRKEGRVRG